MITWPEGPVLRAQSIQEIKHVVRTAKDKEELFRGILKNKKTILWICLGYTRDFVEAEDLTQEVFFKAWTKIDSLRDPARHREWLFRMARNTCLDYQKKRRVRRHFQRSLAKDIPDARTPERSTVYRDELRRLKDAVRSLPKKLRDTFVLRSYGGLSYREIASVLKIKEGTVMSRLNEAREKIRSRMREQTHGRQNGIRPS